MAPARDGHPRLLQAHGRLQVRQLEVKQKGPSLALIEVSHLALGNVVTPQVPIAKSEKEAKVKVGKRDGVC